MLILAQIWSCFELLRVSRQNNLIIGSGYPRWRNTHVASKVTNTNCQLAASTNVHMHYVLARKNQIICQHLLKIFKSICWDPKNIPRDLPVPWSVLPCGFLWEQGKPRTSFPYWGAIFIWGPHPPFFERGRRSCRWVYIPWYSHITSTSSKPPWKIAIKSPWNPHKFKHHFSAPWISKRSHTMNFDGEIGWSSHPFTAFVPVSWDHLDHERHAQDQLLPSVAGGGDPKGTTKVHRSETSTLLMKTTMFLGDLRNNKMYLSAYIMGYAMGYMNIHIYIHICIQL